MNPKGLNRSSSHGRKRPSKPPNLHRRVHSYIHVPSQSPNAGQATRPTLGGARRVVTEVTNQDDDARDEMAGFLQFCTTCEKQIVTPGNTILYCSEACRRRDISMPTPPIQTSMPAAASYFDMPPTDIVPQRSPTVVRPASLVFSDSSSSDLSLLSQDLRQMDVRKGCHGLNTTVQHDFGCDETDSTSNFRPRLNRASTTFDGGMPSLSNTPSSSIGTAASWSSYRPLPPRHDPSTGHFPKKSIDLVMPNFPTTAPSSPSETMSGSSLKSTASTITSFRVAEAADVSFTGRRPSAKSGDNSSSSLKQLLN